MVRANAVLMRSRAVVSCWKKAAGSSTARATGGVVLLPEGDAGVFPEHLVRRSCPSARCGPHGDRVARGQLCVLKLDGTIATFATSPVSSASTPVPRAASDTFLGR